MQGTTQRFRVRITTRDRVNDCAKRHKIKSADLCRRAQNWFARVGKGAVEKSETFTDDMATRIEVAGCHPATGVVASMEDILTSYMFEKDIGGIQSFPTLDPEEVAAMSPVQQ